MCILNGRLNGWHVFTKSPFYTENYKDTWHSVQGTVQTSNFLTFISQLKAKKIIQFFFANEKLIFFVQFRGSICRWPAVTHNQQFFLRSFFVAVPIPMNFSSKTNYLKKIRVLIEINEPIICSENNDKTNIT